MEKSGHLHAPAGLPLGKELLVSIQYCLIICFNRDIPVRKSKWQCYSPMFGMSVCVVCVCVCVRCVWCVWCAWCACVRAWVMQVVRNVIHVFIMSVTNFNT
jgi:hypothetical protein